MEQSADNQIFVPPAICNVLCFFHQTECMPPSKCLLTLCCSHCVCLQLIAPDMALFAAHCGSAAQAIIGPYNLDDVQGGYRNVILTVPHPNYPSGDLLVNFDISIAFFDRPSTDKKPIKLNFDDSLPSTSGEPLTMLGFGSVIGGKETFTPDGPNQQARILQVAPTEYVSFDDCAVAVDPESGNGYGVSPTDTIVQPHWFCTLLNDPITTSTCYGDSGGRKF